MSNQKAMISKKISLPFFWREIFRYFFGGIFKASLSSHSLSQDTRPCRLSGVGKDGKSCLDR
ncbi:hypothetical protein HMPREF0322_01920 [Desulfitobacterium hafniense DP7]|uniref:Uncharacterized protein n=1 Tax=Desulfitobacterium hafniense DP7 TaxID=537010 RepID=G9XLT4_DESHA|nr:hypothetical protein HMPREF0322_01920 [Desulfitobacterium hafniense DP7]